MPTSPADCTRKLVSGSAHVSPAVGQFAIEEMARLQAENARMREALTSAAKIINAMWLGKLPECFTPTLEVVNQINIAIGPVSLAEQAANQRREISKDRTVPK